MAVKILLADKSITIQKVVEMLFSGKEYEVLCVSDGETALSESSRIIPDVILADIDLPRIDGYSFSARLKQIPALAGTPVILMMSRDDVFEEAKARGASIVDHIAKPFESQELIGKVKKAVSAAPPRPAESKPAGPRPAAAPRPNMPPTARVDAMPGAAVKTPVSKQPLPSDIFDIIQEAPSKTDLQRAAVSSADEEGIFEVEPVIEVEEQIAPHEAAALPIGDKAVEEMRAGLGLGGEGLPPEQDIVSFESLDMATSAADEYLPPKQEERVAREWKPPVSPAPAQKPAGQQAVARNDPWHRAESAHPSQVSEAMLRSSVEEAVNESVSRIVKEIARDVIEKVAWEVVPDLAAALIKAEIERLKAEQ